MRIGKGKSKEIKKKWGRTTTTKEEIAMYMYIEIKEEENKGNNKGKEEQRKERKDIKKAEQDRIIDKRHPYTETVDIMNHMHV